MVIGAKPKPEKSVIFAGAKTGTEYVCLIFVTGSKRKPERKDYFRG